MSEDQSDTAPLSGLVVFEIGERYGAGLCSSMLAQLGADVYFLEGGEIVNPASKWPHREIIAVGKHRCDLGTNIKSAKALAARADVIVSSDMDGASRREIAAAAGTGSILCNVTAFGGDGPLAGHRYSDAMVQAVSGLMDVTGMPDGGPVPSSLLLAESSAGLYAAAGVLAAIRVRNTSGRAQNVEIALYDCAVNFLTTFLPAHYGAEPPTRLGNGHSMVVPWNCYDTLDGRVQICSVTDRQWQQLCRAIGRPDIEADASMAKLAGRVPRRKFIDDAIQAWTKATPSADCIRILNAANIACGQVMRLDDLAHDPNLAHRQMVRAIDGTGGPLTIPASPIHGRQWSGRTPASTQGRGSGNNAWHDAVATEAAPLRHGTAAPGAPLAGIRVIEIGQFTTAPLAGKALASLGAEIVKIEPPGGDSARQWSPHLHGLSYFFVLSNSDKLSVEIDLMTDEGKRDFTNLIRSADVLLENMKAGSLDRLGFSPEVLAEINPALIYCPISGFGRDGVYTGRPAFDTVVQAMSGLMDMTHHNGMPIKCGPSICDVSGGQLALIAVLAAFLHRDRTGLGTCFDLSMQDIGAYLTQSGWNGKPSPLGSISTCVDGFVYVEGGDPPDGRGRTCDDVLSTLRQRGIDGTRVLTISEVAVSAQTQSRRLLIDSEPVDGKTWPLLNSPIRLSLTPTVVKRAIGNPEKISDSLRRRLRIPLAG